jgi:hypothetical protein
MEKYHTSKLRLLQITQLTLAVGCYFTFLQLQGYGLFFAALSGYIIGDFVKTLNLDLWGDKINNDNNQ